MESGSSRHYTLPEFQSDQPRKRFAKAFNLWIPEEIIKDSGKKLKQTQSSTPQPAKCEAAIRWLSLSLIHPELLQSVEKLSVSPLKSICLA
jgi:hypothetical protein